MIQISDCMISTIKLTWLSILSQSLNGFSFCPNALCLLTSKANCPSAITYRVGGQVCYLTSYSLSSNTFFFCKFALLVKSRHEANKQKKKLLAHILLTHFPLHFSLKAPTVYTWPTFLHIYRSVMLVCIWKIELYLCLQYIHCMTKCSINIVYEYCFCKEKHPHPYFVGSTEYTDT